MMTIRPILSTLSRHKTAATLIVLEIALSCAIICNALYLVAQRLETLTMPSGIDESHLVMVRMAGIGKQTDGDARTREDLASLRTIPGVTDAVIVNQLPFQRGSWNTSLTHTPDQAVPTLSAAMYRVGAGSLKAMGLKLVEGRDFAPDEFTTTQELKKRENYNGLSSAVILTAAAAKKMFPDGKALGRTVYTANVPLTVVGIVDTLVRPRMVENNRDYSMLLPVAHNFADGGLYLLRVSDPGQRAAVLKSAVAALGKNDPNRLIASAKTYDEQRREFFANDRDMIGLLLIVTMLLLLVTALGIVGLASFWVQQRTKQIGVRRALGATRGQILQYFQTENFLLSTLGIIVGMVGAFGINQFLMTHYELPRLPLLYLPLGAAILWILGQVAVFGPARRASAIPPALATRSV